MRTISIDEAGGNLADTIARVAGERQPLGIGNNGIAEVVLVPAAELERLRKFAAASPARTLFDRAGRMARLGYWEWDEIADHCADCSDELARIYDLTVDEYLKLMNCTQAWLDRIHVEDRDRVERAVLDCRRRNSGFDLEYRLLRLDGTVLNVRQVAEPILDDKGRMIWSTGIVQDLTEQKRLELELRHSHDVLEERVRERTAELRASNEALKKEVAERRDAESALRESEEQLRQVTDNLPILIGLVDREERFVWCNKVLGEWMARPRAEIIGRRQDEVDSPADYKAIEPWVRAVLSGERTENECTIEYPDGITRHVLRVSVPAFGPDGAVSGYYFFIHDITERKKAEQAMREYSDRLALITDNLPALIAYVDADECYKFVNKRCCEWYARVAEDILDRHVSDIHRDNYDKFEGRFRQVREGRSVEFEDRSIYPDGVTRDIRATYLPHKAPDGTVVGIFSLVEDVTAFKQAEERARQSQKMEAVGQLTGGVAHDFNNLLAVIIGNAEMLVEDLGEDDPSPSAILRAARRGTELTQRLLAFSRRQPLDPQPVALGDLVDGMLGLLTRTLGESIEIEISREAGLWPAMADAGQVENALLNLAINARDAMPGGGRLTLECMNARLDEACMNGNADTTPGDYTVLAVSDSGSGMPPSVLEHVFEPFFTTKEVGQGTGLGLSMIYGFAKQSGGHVTIYSEEGKGTTVKLYLPRSSENAVPCGPADLADLPRGRGETVLLLEDDDDVRALAVRILEGMGYRVIAAARAEAAEEALARAERVDLLLSDVVLPGVMNGPDFARKAREIKPSLKILFMSGYPAEAARRNGFADLGGAPLLKKPLERRQLAEALHEALQD